MLKDEDSLGMAHKDAVRCRWIGVLVLLCGLGAKHVTPNFEVEAPTAAIAEKVARTAEHCREDLAVEWLGHKLPNWFKPCKVRVKVGQIGAGGATTFSFAGGEVYGWDMTVQGSLERILDSVIPHEVSHTIFACHFRRPLPRWADEGAATLAEEDSERRRQQKLAEEVMPSKRRIPLRELLSITEYPKNMQHVLTLYAEGYSLADFLVQKGGKPRFLAFMQEAHLSGWDSALRRHYEEDSVEELESKWNQWVIAGSPALRVPDGTLLAGGDAAAVVRSQNPEPKSAGSTSKSGETVVAAATNNAPTSRRESIEASATANTVAFAIEPPSEPRRPRGAHLSRPELRRPHESTSPLHASSLDEHWEPAPSPFQPIDSATTTRGKSLGTRVNPDFVQPATFRRK
jgi:hypothetical protein